MRHLRVELRLMSTVATGTEVVDNSRRPSAHCGTVQSLALQNANRLSRQVAANRGVAVAAWALGAGVAQSVSGPAKCQTGLKTCEDCRTPL